MTVEFYDLIIIGGGPGGYVAGSYASQFGKKTAVVEKKLLGGCCLNVGCIPTKTLLEAAARYGHAFESKDYGVLTDHTTFSWFQWRQYSDKIKTDLRKGIHGLLRSRKCDIIQGEASLVDEHTVSIDGNHVAAETIILATGSRPCVPLSFMQIKSLVNSDSFWNLEEQPEELLIVGGGITGCEIASAMSRLGTKVTIIEQQPELLPMFGSEASVLLRDELTRWNVDILCGRTVTDAKQEDKVLLLSVGDKTLRGDCLLWTAGREGNPLKTGRLKLRYTDRGFIAVDQNFQTSVENIYCIGDANGQNMLAHAAISQAMLTVRYICTGEPITVAPLVPQTVFTSPAIARLGQTERECKCAAVGQVPYSAVGYSHVAGAKKGYFKVIRDIETDTLVGAEIVGYGACELIHNLAPFINRKLDTRMFSDIMYAHPTLTEGIKLAVEASYTRSPQV